MTDAFLRALPKTDLHVHLDGSLRISTLIDLARTHGVELPSYSEDGLRQTLFKERYESLADYLRGFRYMVAVMQTPEALERVARELAEDNQAEGVRYVEVRFAPQLHVHDGMSTVDVLHAVNRGLLAAKESFNSRPEVRQGQEPPFAYGIICCAMRMFQPAFSTYYGRLFNAHRYSDPKEVYPLASLELARAAVNARDTHGLPVVGFDLAGEEKGYPAENHAAAFGYAHKNYLKKTVHAGEAYGPESIFQAITDLHAERIGHGTYLLDPTAIRSNGVADKQGFVEQLVEYIADRRITLEICLTSNLQTNPHIKTLADHPFAKLRQRRLSTTLCTDNRTVSNTTVTGELSLAVQHFGLDRHHLRSIVIYGFKRSFFPGDYLSKRGYVRRVIDYYLLVEKRFLGEERERSLMNTDGFDG